MMNPDAPLHAYPIAPVRAPPDAPDAPPNAPPNAPRPGRRPRPHPRRENHGAQPQPLTSREKETRQYLSREDTKDAILRKRLFKLMNGDLVPIKNLLEDKTPRDWCVILFTGSTIPPESFEHAESLWVTVCFAGQWFKYFRFLLDKWFSFDNPDLNVNQNYIDRLKTLLEVLANPNTTDSHRLARMSDYNTIRAMHNNADYMPKFVFVTTVPESIKKSFPEKCNINIALCAYETKMSKKYSVPTSEVLKRLPGTDTFSKYFKIPVDALSNAFKLAFVADPTDALETHREIRDLLDITPEDIDEDMLSIPLCSCCGITVTNIRWHIENLLPHNLLLNEKGFKALKSATLLDDISNLLEIKCHGDIGDSSSSVKQCGKIMPFKKLVTLFYQSCAILGTKATAEDKQFIKDITRTYTAQAMRLLCPKNLIVCKTVGCKASHGMLFLNEQKLNRIECNYCFSTICINCNLQGPEYHYNGNCTGYLETNMDPASIAYLLALGMKMCPGCNQGCLKLEWCDHITCRTPGCGTHFCYRCGNRISSTGMGTHLAVCPFQEEAPGILALEAQAQAQQAQQAQAQEPM